MRVGRATPEAGPQMEWPTLGMLVLAYGGWVTAGVLVWPESPASALVLMTLFTVLHSSLVHEALHGHPTRYPWLNELLVSVPLGLVWPYRRFRALHLRHHVNALLTDPEEDPESAYWESSRYRRFSHWRRRMLIVNNTLLGRMVLGPGLSAAALVMRDLRGLRDSPRALLLAWGLHAVGVALVLALLHRGFGIGAGVYLVTVVWGSFALLALRTYAEHRWHPDPQARCIIVESTPLAWLYLNNNLHLVHHRYPGVAWYKLPGIYQAYRDHWSEMSGGYVYRGYWPLFRAYAMRAKEPVVHPVLGARETAAPSALQ